MIQSPNCNTGLAVTLFWFFITRCQTYALIRGIGYMNPVYGRTSRWCCQVYKETNREQSSFRQLLTEWRFRRHLAHVACADAAPASAGMRPLQTMGPPTVRHRRVVPPVSGPDGQRSMRHPVRLDVHAMLGDGERHRRDATRPHARRRRLSFSVRITYCFRLHAHPRDLDIGLLSGPSCTRAQENYQYELNIAYAL